MADAPYLSMQRFPGNGTTTDWTVNFAGNTPSNENWYIKADDIEAIEVIPATLTAAEVRIKRTVTRIGPSQFRVTPAVASGRILVLRRKTENRFNLVDFQSLQAVSEYDLDLANKQLLFVTQEAVDQARLAEEASVSSESVAYGSINIALDAQDQAIRATSVANGATATANSALTQAGMAVSKADAATAAANAAVLKGNIAVDTANIAFNSAGSAQQKADAATAASNLATTTANLALNRAETAITTSTTAKNTADTARAAAAEAVETANAGAAAGNAALQTVNQANANASEALETANGIAGTANAALAQSAAAIGTANEAMTLVTSAGVNTFNGRAGQVTAAAGDYNSTQITHGESTVSGYMNGLNERITASNQELTVYVNNQVATRLASNATAVDSHKLGGQTASYYATAAALTNGLNGKLNYWDKAVSAATADKLTTARAINGVNFDGTANITVRDDSKLHLTGGAMAAGAEIRFDGSGNNWAGIGMDPNRAYSLRIHSPGVAYTYIGARNSSWTHYESGTGSHYFYGQIQAQGNITAYSDIRLKTDIEIIRSALDKVELLGGYTYKRTDLEDSRQAGVLAQQVQAVLPEAVREDPESGMLAVSYNGVVALLVEAINELRQEVKELRNGAAK